MLNLLPAGQLDGGHIVYALFGRWHKIWSRIFIALLVILGRLTNSWLWYVWAFLLLFALRHPVICDEAPLGAKRKLLGWVALALLAASDIMLTTLVYRYPFSWDHFVTWAWYAAMLWLGSTLRQNAGPLRIMVSALAGSVVFFLVSNFAVWAAWKDSYPMTFAGLLTSYGAGWPFFRRAVEGDLFFTAAMFSVPVVLHSLAGWLQKSNDHTAAA